MAGNTLVLKPPTQGSVAGLLMVQCFAAAGIPPGVINCVTGETSHWTSLFCAGGFLSSASS
jgi:glyceraldehyde-3-phosphate dehydrogenase (NADP+)